MHFSLALDPYLIEPGQQRIGEPRCRPRGFVPGRYSATGARQKAGLSGLAAYLACEKRV
jgi:hypothetical protein